MSVQRQTPLWQVKVPQQSALAVQPRGSKDCLQDPLSQ